MADIEPIYCAEQIVVPHDLADILKAYTKEVIRRQPEDLLEFSAIYFANLAKLAQDVDEVVAPSREQLRSVFESLPEASAALGVGEVTELCRQAGIREVTLNKVLQLGGFQDADTVDASQVLILLLSTSSDNFSSVVGGLFEIFGSEGELESEAFLSHFEYLTSLDGSGSKETSEALAKSLEETPKVTFASIGANSVLKDRLAAV